MSDKKEYDRSRSKKMYDKYKDDRKRALDLKGFKCQCCPQTSANKLQFHHLYYDEKSNYPRTSNGWSRIKRVAEVLDDPNKFCLLCSKCHYSIHIVKSAISCIDNIPLFLELSGLKTHILSD